ncbi:head GIN domain-containing protein [Flavobacterium xinjiangense]|uniref:Putative auto-transporter adhesin, head GIN domain n=1 Tax=Flavobacterium xinjiangense TaxID=178356 RepID=A0A1M7PFR3_9FLAO|nr:head GIN domain-containing protein [Flavobacterium xinjiangense]SHN15921.1 Putative auto-transporter adhesin, head GIN domain [Flavobacterium xinjiangense]
MKNSIKLLVICSLLLTSMTYAQWSSIQIIKGNGKVTSVNKSTDPYNAIAIEGFFDVELVSGKVGNITIKGEENLLPYIKVEVVGQVLKISRKKYKYIFNGQKIILVVPIESINQVSLTGSGHVITKNSIKSKSFSGKLIGSGDMNLEIESNDVSLNLSGSGNIRLTGTTEKLNSNLYGSGDIQAANLKAKNVKANVSGSGDTSVYCSESIYARVSGSGNVEYRGNPKQEDTRVNGSGGISKA